MNHSLRICIAIVTGAIIGGLIAREMYPLFWWFGALAGAGTAYLGFNLEEVVAAIPVAFNRAVAWRPDYEYWGYWREGFWFAFNLGVNIVVGAGIIGALGNWRYGEHAPEANATFLLSMALVAVASIAFGLLLGLIIAGAIPEGIRQDKRRGIFDPSKYEPLTAPNVFRFYLWVLPRSVVTVLWWLIVHTPRVIEVTAVFLGSVVVAAAAFSVEFIRQIHSELRVLCAVYAALGTAIGYFSGQLLIGAAVGGVLGVVNYEIITIRVLKLAGAKSMFK